MAMVESSSVWGTVAMVSYLQKLLTSVDVVESIKSTLGLSNYTGDPCLPAGYGYNWLNCSKDNPGMTAIILSNYQTGGKIPTELNQLTTLTDIYLDGNNLQGDIPDLSYLESLVVLNLSNNKLSGSIPSSLAKLKNLKALYLQNNNLSGKIPDALLRRQNASLLTFEYSGNPSLCQPNGGECTPSPSSSPQAQANDSNRKKNDIALIVGIIIGCFMLVIAISAAGICLLCYCRTKKSNLQNKATESYQVPPVERGHIEVQKVMLERVIPNGQLQQFSSEQIKSATNNFYIKLGEGGFGSVYRGSLEDKRQVAIKVSSRSSHQGLKEFMNEVDLLSRVHHRNLVDLIGYSNEDNLILVYEFMPSGSLFDCLHGPRSKSSPLSWETRLSIMIDAAQGLHYLHDGCKPEIIHRDIKSSNILMNDKMEAKLADFGISRNKLMNATEAAPTIVMGSKGYVDPEYITSLKLTEKVDVYSFGVVLFEVVCGRRSTFYTLPTRQEARIVDWAKSSILRGMIDDIVDPSLGGHYDVDSVWKVLEVALACVEMPSSKRPSMNQVCQDLKEALDVQHRSRNMDVDPPHTGYSTEMSTSFLTNVVVR
ncbi:hypothetical protein KP509_04G093000 [Ceratopteris richardii]|uniref:Protein kinase domain-containing protein n=1 Tax=Ceratopteris richardii TaxID=49495 RepID=A0A8T2UV75_CERRI|nr:hypothetical protein KP509_04G093000 [Ceratopteris richardii]